MSINLNTITVALPSACGEGAEYKVDMAKFPTHILEALLAHGLKQKIADSVANATKLEWTKEQSLAATQGALDALLAGTWAKKGGGARITTLAAYMDSEANKAAKLRYAKDQKLPAAPSYFAKLATDAERVAHVAKVFRNHEVLMSKWVKEWAARQEAKAVEIDLGELLDEPEATEE